MSYSDEKVADEDIARMVQSGKTEFFGLLIKRYENKMMRYARKFLLGHEDAEDLVQEVFLKAYVNIQSFDVSRKFSSWLYRIAHNEFINAIKKKRREPIPFFNIDILLPTFVSEETADREANKREMREMIDRCLKELSPKYRELFILYYFEQLNYREIADILRIPISTVGVRLKRGREIIKKIINANKIKL